MGLWDLRETSDACESCKKREKRAESSLFLKVGQLIINKMSGHSLNSFHSDEDLYMKRISDIFNMETKSAGQD